MKIKSNFYINENISNSLQSSQIISSLKPKKRIAIGFSSSAYNLLQRLKTRKHVQLIGLTPGAASQIDQLSENVLVDHPYKIFRRYWCPGSTFLVVGAIGAVLRIISPLIKDKNLDPAVIVMDFGGKNIVPILGAHKAGAEEFACDLAQDLGGNFVSTGFSRKAEILSIDSFGKSWGWKRSGESSDWNDLMIHLSKQDLISVEQSAGSNIWNSSKGALQTFLPPNVQNMSGSSLVMKITSHAGEACSWHPATLWIGIGCERNSSQNLLERSIEESLTASGLAKESIAGFATIDIKSDEIAIKAILKKYKRPIRFYSSKELLSIHVPNPSEIVFEEVGTFSVAEASSLLASGQSGVLQFEKHVYKANENNNEEGAVTIAIAESKDSFAPHRGELHIIGSGPGDLSLLTHDARFALSRSAVWIGYKLYLDLLEPFRRFDQVRIDSQITNEIDRCKQALQLAIGGARVSLVSSGDSGVYGMAGLALELLLAKPKSDRPHFQVHPGISALQAAAAKIGAPLMHDFCLISLSDCLTPWEKIEERIKAASESDFVIGFYNPRSKERNWQLKKAIDILLENRPESTPIIFARQIGRTEEKVEVYKLGSLPIGRVDMLTLLLVGNSMSFVEDGYVVTPRGY